MPQMLKLLAGNDIVVEIRYASLYGDEFSSINHMRLNNADAIHLADQLKRSSCMVEPSRRSCLAQLSGCGSQRTSVDVFEHDHTPSVWKIWTIAQTDGHQFRGQTRVLFSKAGCFHTSGALVRKNPRPLEACFCVRLRRPPPKIQRKKPWKHNVFQGLECTEFPDALRAKRHSGGWRDVRLAAGHLKGPGS